MEEIKLKIITAEGIKYEIEEQIACKSQLIKNIAGGAGIDKEIPLPNVKSEILEKVIEYCRHYKDTTPLEIEKPLKSSVMSEIVPSWDANFVELEQEVLFELLNAANYLDIQSLVDLTCAKVASMLTGKTGEEIRKQFNIENNFTPEEEAQVREANKWDELE